ncbi:MAG TPA: lysophospholipid acyltransferase family protein [Gemmatimonadaceae bacterium]|nr:lysophospholipid acyltransferase family protein [Gemmatimonadaceae bacterium]
MNSVALGADSETGRLDRAVRVFRAGLMFAVWLPSFVIVFAIVQRLILMPLIMIVPRWRARIMGPWLRFQGDWCVLLMRTLGGCTVTVHGSIPKEAVVVVMNHQSVADIPIALSIIRDPGPLFATREWYKWRIPFVSPALRLSRMPLVTQRAGGVRQDIAALNESADRCAKGEVSLLLFAEGHRTRDGQIGPFMRMGPRLILPRARRPVYTIVADGLWGARTFTDALAKLGNCRIDLVISGPYETPESTADLDGFIEHLRYGMITTLDDIRRGAVT